MSLSFLIKPSVDTKFYIDYEWWEQSRDDLQVYLLTHLSQEQRQSLRDRDLREVFDYVHPETGEVFQLDTLRLAIKQSSKGENFVGENIGLIDSVFRALLVNGNQPLSALELGDVTGRDPEKILKTIGGIRIYRGIRPHHSAHDTNA